MTYPMQVVPEHVRSETVKKLADSSVETTDSWDVYPGVVTKLKVVVVPIELPVYRLSNGRTRSGQLELIADKSLPENYFSEGQENVEAQAHQHTLLEEFAKEGGENVTPIMDVLRSERQREEIVLSPSGVVLNGNRRLAAMRTLYAENPHDFSAYANVKCAILPVLTPAQALDMEVRLQMRPQTLLEYTWLDEALTIEDARTTRTVDQVADLMNKTKQQVNLATASLLEARTYLSDWLGKPNAYHLVRNKQQFFQDLSKALKGKTSEEIDAARRIAWTLDTSSDRSGRVYSYNFVFNDKVEEVVKRVESSLGDLTPLDLSGGDEFEVSFEEETPSKLASFAAAISDPATSAAIKDAVETVAQELVTEKANASSAANPLKLVRSARSTLESVAIGKAATETLMDLVGQLTQIETRAHELRLIAEAKLTSEER
jgi:hypothetical protein